MDSLPDNARKRCCTCKESKPLIEFHKDSTSKDGHVYRCKVCACFHARRHHKRRMAEDPAYKDAKRNNYVMSAWGMTADEYEAKWKAQGICSICGIKLTGGSQTHLDHSHSDGTLRGFLCTNCNRGLGHFKENRELLMNAINYLNEHSKEVVVHE